MLIIMAFLCGFAMDVIWASCVAAVTSRQAGLAAHLSVGLYLCTLVSTVLIVDGQWVPVISFIAGNWLGTFCTVRWWS